MGVEELRFRSLGTEINIKLLFSKRFSESKKDEIKAGALEIYEKYNFKLSRFDPASEISALNDNIGIWQEVSDELFLLLNKSVTYNQETSEIFDPRIITELEARGYDKNFSLVADCPRKEQVQRMIFDKPLIDDIHFSGERQVKILRRFDIAGLAKGYITDRVVDFLRKKGLRDFMVDSGGDMFCHGKNIDKGNDWIVSLEGYPEDKFLIKLSDKAIATSGISRKRWKNQNKEVHHLVDPRDLEKSDFAIRSVSVIGETVEWVDVWAKTLFILGRKDGLRLANEKNIAVFFLDSRGNLHISKSAKSFIAI